MFKGPVPPVVPFSLGSLGFMTPFCILIFPLKDFPSNIWYTKLQLAIIDYIITWK